MNSETQIAVLPVRDRHTAKQFVELPFRLYADDPSWIPPLRADMHKFISPKHNPIFAEAEIENFVAVDRHGKAVGRISATIHPEYNRRFGEEHAFFGFLEFENDALVAKELFRAVTQWATARGKHVLTGPYSYTSTQDAAVLLENIDGRPPTILQTYNFPYYAELLEQAGFQLAFTFSTYGLAQIINEKTPRLRSLGDRMRQKNSITVRSATKEDLKNHLEEIRRMFNDAFAGNYEVAPISPAVFKFQVDSVRPFIDLEGVRVIEANGVPAAFFLILPDLNEILAKLKGRFGLLDLIRLPFYRRGIKKGVIALIGANANYHGAGLGRIIADEITRYADLRYKELHTMWIDDRNPSSYVLANNGGMTRTKRYGVFRKVLLP